MLREQAFRNKIRCAPQAVLYVENDRLLCISSLWIIRLGRIASFFVTQLVLPLCDSFLPYFVLLFNQFCLYLCPVGVFIYSLVSIYNSIDPFDLPLVPCSYWAKLFNISQRLTLYLLVLLLLKQHDIGMRGY